MDYEKLYQVYYMKVYSFVLNLCKDKDLAEEITQKTFYKTMVTKNKHRKEASEYSWLCSIAKNLFLDEVRKKQKIGEWVEEPADQIDIEKNLVEEDTTFMLHQILHDLEEPYKEVFQLRVFGELSFAKIGVIFGKTENWARVTYHRSRLKIQERMEENEI